MNGETPRKQTHDQAGSEPGADGPPADQSVPLTINDPAASPGPGLAASPGAGAASPGNGSSSINGFDMLDGATATRSLPLTAELEAQRRLATSPDYPIEERLEAFEDIIDSEIGDTDLTRARNIEREYGLRQVYFKFEGGNPSGSQKDRIAFAQAMDALRRGFDTITMATCGNYGAAMAIAARMAGLRCLVYIPENYRTKRVQEMIELGSEIIRIPGDYENAVAISRGEATRREFYDANPGGANTALQLRAYAEIAHEIYDELRDAPAAVAVPVSNGTTLAGIYRGFLSLFRRGKTSRMPRFVAGSSLRKNPIVQAYLTKSEHCLDLVPNSIKETRVNEPLVNWHSIDGDLALDAIRTSRGWAAYASDSQMLAMTRQLRDQQGLHTLPASTAGFHALLERHRLESLPGDRYVVILTGRQS